MANCSACVGLQTADLRRLTPVRVPALPDPLRRAPGRPGGPGVRVRAARIDMRSHCTPRHPFVVLLLAVLAVRRVSSWISGPPIGAALRRFCPSSNGLLIRGVQSKKDDQLQTTGPTLLSNETQTSESDASNISEAQLLLACRAYLIRKHKVEWKRKIERAQAEVSSANSGYFWPDPEDLRYLREDPDPFNLDYNETYASSFGYRRNGIRFSSQDLIDKTEQPDNTRETTSANPFSANPLYPSDEHVRRSTAKLKLWRNQTWVSEWYNKRWAGRVTTRSQKNQEKQANLLRQIPNDVFGSPSFYEMTEDEVAEALATYLMANQRKSQSRLSIKDTRQIEQESFTKWRESVKQEVYKSTIAEKNLTLRHIFQKELPSNASALSFSPSQETMERLRAQRSEKSRRAFQTRIDRSKENITKTSTKILHGYNRQIRYTENDFIDGQVSPMQAILNIDLALDNDILPSPIDVEIMLKPGRLGRRRATLIRILRECFHLRGKCVPALSGDPKLLFVTTCTIHELGVFVLSKLRQQVGEG